MERRAPTLLYDMPRTDTHAARIATKESTQISPDTPWWTPSNRAPQQLGAVKETFQTYRGETTQRDVGVYLAELQNGIPYAFLQTEQDGQRTLRYPFLPLGTSSDHLPIPGVDAKLYSIYASVCGPQGIKCMESQIGIKKEWPQGENSMLVAVDPFEGRYLYYTLVHKTPTKRIKIHASTKAFPGDRSIRPIPLLSLTIDHVRNGQTIALAFRSNGTLGSLSDRQGNTIDIDNPQPLLQRLLKTAPHQDIHLNIAQTLHNLMKNIKRKTPQNPISQLAWV